MQSLTTTSLRIRENQLWILDQQALPQRSDWRECRDVSELVDHIRSLRVRGAPLIGLSASLLLALLAENGMPQDALHHSLDRLRASRPTAVNLMNNLDRMKIALQRPDFVTALVEEALRLVDEDRTLCESIAMHGATLVTPGSRLLTHCNTGGLATAGVGTAIGVIRRAHEQGHVQQVWVDETRPLLQGGRLTAWELGELGIPYQLICDSMAASLMAQKQVDAIWVGADRIAANGDVANKIGTYSLAVLANITAFRSTSPRHIPRTIRTARTVPPFPLNSAMPAKSPAFPAALVPFSGHRWMRRCTTRRFDVTPAELISGWVLDIGVVTPEQVKEGIFHQTLI
jgi:methylthioribose-1-phosphate isomerase